MYVTVRSKIDLIMRRSNLVLIFIQKPILRHKIKELADTWIHGVLLRASEEFVIKNQVPTDMRLMKQLYLFNS